MITLFECRVRKPSRKNTTSLSTLLISILFVVSAHPHKAHQFDMCVSIENERKEKETRRERERESEDI